MTRRRCVSRVTIAVTALMIAGSTFGQSQEEVSIGIASTSFASSAPRVAQEMGLFAKHGLNAKFVVMDSANSTVTALISGSLNVIGSGPGELVVAQGRGQKVVAIADIYEGHSGTVVLSKTVADKLQLAADAPPAERLKALDGLLIGSPSATSSHTVSLNSAAKAAGASVRFVYMAQPTFAAALESGAIQGYIASAPFWALPVVRGTGVTWLSGPKGEFPPDFSPASSSMLQMMRPYAEANRQLVERLVAVNDDLGRAIKERPAEVKSAVAALFPTLDAPTVDLLFESEKTAWSADPLTAGDMAHEIEYVKRNGANLPEIDNVDPASVLFR